MRRTGVRVVHNAGGVEGLSIAYDVCGEDVEARIFEASAPCAAGDPLRAEMAIQKTGARRQTDWRLMKNPSKKQTPRPPPRASRRDVHSFRHYAWFDWSAAAFARDHILRRPPAAATLTSGASTFPIGRAASQTCSCHFDPQGHSEKRSLVCPSAPTSSSSCSAAPRGTPPPPARRRRSHLRRRLAALDVHLPRAPPSPPPAPRPRASPGLRRHLRRRRIGIRTGERRRRCRRQGSSASRSPPSRRRRARGPRRARAARRGAPRR